MYCNNEVKRLLGWFHSYDPVWRSLRNSRDRASMFPSDLSVSSVTDMELRPCCVWISLNKWMFSDALTFNLCSHLLCSTGCQIWYHWRLCHVHAVHGSSSGHSDLHRRRSQTASSYYGPRVLEKCNNDQLKIHVIIILKLLTNESNWRTEH